LAGAQDYRALDPAQREELFAAFGQADLRWMALAILVGWLSHVSRAWRWRYISEALGPPAGFLELLPRGDDRVLHQPLPPQGRRGQPCDLPVPHEKVPFEQGFGTILAERAVDLLMLLGIGGLTLLLQLDKLDLFRARIAAFRQGQGTPAEGPSAWSWLMGALLLAGLAGVLLLRKRPLWRAKAMDLARGFLEGLKAVFRTRDRAGFLLHTVLIWAAYVGMFQSGFLALPSMAAVPLAGVLAGFTAGAIGIVLVQGGVGVYPAFVALITSVYMPPAGDALINPDALAMGWLLWTAQTLLLIVLGGLSLLLVSFRKPLAA
jgi:hypothetical protein